MAAVGTWAWSRASGGRLSRTEEFRYTMALARAVVTSRHRRAPSPLTREVTLAGAPPDSAFARAAHAEAADLWSPALLGHCLRAWLYADLLAQARGLRHDPELLYAACVLHDLALTDAHRQRRTECFAVEGAPAAHDLATAHDYPRSADLAEAVSLHLNVTVPVQQGPEAHLLHAGTTTDLLGRGCRSCHGPHGRRCSTATRATGSSTRCPSPSRSRPRRDRGPGSLCWSGAPGSAAGSGDAGTGWGA